MLFRLPDAEKTGSLTWFVVALAIESLEFGINDDKLVGFNV
jgi:hypothetical protein